MSLLLPNKERGIGGAALDARAVREAIEFLEIELPVEIKWANGTRRRGAHRFRRVPGFLGREATFKHVITLSTYLDPVQASVTLWHELTHAAQCEEHESFAKFDRAYDAENERYGYEGNRFEREARDFSKTFAAEMPLTR